MEPRVAEVEGGLDVRAERLAGIANPELGKAFAVLPEDALEKGGSRLRCADVKEHDGPAGRWRHRRLVLGHS